MSFLLSPDESITNSTSRGSKLHYSHLDISRGGNAHYVVFLRYAYISCLAGPLLTCLDFQNRYGASNGSKALLIIVGILNAARNSFSFFLLLIVCMGYGVVKPTLGRTMIYVRWLAAAHFVFGLVYSITSLLISPENAGKKKNVQMYDIVI